MAVHLESYKTVMFDAGDTLLNVLDAQQIVAKFLQKRHYMCDEKKVAVALHDSIQRHYYQREKDEQAVCSPELDRAFWVKVYSDMFARLELQALTEDRMQRLCHELYEMFTGPEVYSLFDDVKEVLEALRSRGLELAIVSNFAATLPHILEEKGIASYFKEMIVSTLVGWEKPNPEIFRYALQKLGRKPEEVLYIGDHELNDIWAPQQAGIDAIRILRYDYMTGEGIRSLRELLD